MRRDIDESVPAGKFGPTPPVEETSQAVDQTTKEALWLAENRQAIEAWNIYLAEKDCRWLLTESSDVEYSISDHRKHDRDLNSARVLSRVCTTHSTNT